MNCNTRDTIIKLSKSGWILFTNSVGKCNYVEYIAFAIKTQRSDKISINKILFSCDCVVHLIRQCQLNVGKTFFDSLYSI